jgi:hypothetical protein
MIVRFDLEGHSEAVSDVDDAGVLARALEDGRTLGRETSQVDARTFVAAVFGPHHAEDAELGESGLSLQDADDALIFGVCKSVLRELVLGDHYKVFLTEDPSPGASRHPLPEGEGMTGGLSFSLREKVARRAG